jgi:MFS family permease
MSPAVGVATSPLTHNQVRGFWAAWAGWALDGMDSFIDALMPVPSLRELLPNSGIPVTSGNIGYYGGLLICGVSGTLGTFVSMGPIGGSLRACAHADADDPVLLAVHAGRRSFNQHWELRAFRLLAGIGIGGEWTLGGILVAEEWPEQRRVWGAR